MNKKTILENKSDLVRKSILDTAEIYFSQGGIDQVNIRQIAKDIGYSATNIYKYFENKEAIIHALVSKRMIDIASSINQIDLSNISIVDGIKLAFTTHIHRVLAYGEHYKAVMLSNNPLLLERTSMLDPKRVERLPAHKKLIETIQLGITRGELKTIDPIMTSQVLWSSIFGLLIRILVENYTDKNYIQELINHQIDMLLYGIIKVSG